MMKKKLLALFLIIIMMTDTFPLFGVVAMLSENYVTITEDGELVSAVSVPENEERLLSGRVSVITAISYNWQIKIPNTDIWVNIDGYTEPECSISYALVGSMLDKKDRAYIRLSVAADDNNSYTSDSVTVKITEPVEQEVLAIEDQENPVEIYVDTPIILPQEEFEETLEEETLEEMPQEEATEEAPEEEPQEEAPQEPQKELEETLKEETLEEVPEEELEEVPQEEAPEEEIPEEEIPEEAPEEAPQEATEEETTEEIFEEEATEEEPKSFVEEILEAVPEVISELVDAIMPTEASAADIDEEAEPEAPIDESEPTPTTTHDVIVHFLYPDGSKVVQDYMASIAQGAGLLQEIVITSVAGYKPYIDNTSTTDGLKLEENGNVYKLIIDLENIQQDYTFTVRFEAISVQYKVEHYIQNRDDDKYTLKKTETKEGPANSLVPDDLALTGQEAVGHTPQTYERVAIAADGSTVIKIYYLINYYLVEFDLQGGFGTEPVYVRYGTVVRVPTPTNPGYTFGGWTLVGFGEFNEEPTEEQKNKYYLETTVTVPDKNLKYQAKWIEGYTHYTVVYWREAESKYGDESGISYEYWGSETVGATVLEGGGVELDGSVQVGEIVSPTEYSTIPSDIAKNNSGVDETPFFHYNGEKTEEVNKSITVSGDGTSVLNIYFDRNSYNLKFYYAASGNSTYKVIGGSTYYFGKTATSNRSNDVSLFSQYLTARTNTEIAKQVGTVDKMPSLNEEGGKKGYKEGQVQSGNYTLYYIAFNAKYGMDISDMWPTDVFNSVKRSDTGNNGSWTSKTAFVSAWNGEYNVYYTQKNENQTIKGKYNKLDHQLLWDKSVSGVSTYADESEKTLDGLTSTSGTVAFLCFWENGANINWSVPELYRYNIWLECLNQENPAEEGAVKKTFGGSTKWYYRSERYNTIDDSSVDKQTTPPVYGFTNVGRDSTKLTSGNTTDDTHYNKSEYSEGYDVNFYYDRNRYPLVFYNMGEQLMLKDANDNFMEAQDIRYGVSLYAEGGYDITELENYNGTSYYPETLPENAYRFEGWYTSPTFAAGTKFEFDENSTMPASALALYAHWVPKQFEVRIYYNEEYMENGKTLWETTDANGNVRDYTLVDYCAHAPTPNEKYEHPTNEALHFIGWFYKDAEGEEKAWNFVSSQVTQDMKIYAKWSSNVVHTYTIYYKFKDDNGNETDIEVATRSTGSELIGNYVTVIPKAGEQLSEDYQSGYFPEGSSTSLYMDENETLHEATVWYKKAKAVPYVVHYVTMK